MRVGALDALDPATIRQVLPHFLGAHISSKRVRDRSTARVAGLFDEIPDSALVAMRDHLRHLGQDPILQEADETCRSISRVWMQELLTSCKVDGAEGLAARAKQGPVLVLCNHLSYVDTTAKDAALFEEGWSEVADRLVALAGPKVYATPFRRFAAAALHTLPVPQSARVKGSSPLSSRALAQRALASVRTAEALLSDGWVLLLYPEGSRSRTGRLGPFLKATHRYLGLEGLQVVPAAVTGTDRLFPLGARHLEPGAVRLTFGTPFPVAECESRQAALERAHRAISALLPANRRPRRDEPALV